MVGRAMRMVMALIAIAAAFAVAPAFACSVVATARHCADAGNACSAALMAQRENERLNEIAREYGREISSIMDARSDSAGLDRAFDLARLLMPNLVLPVGYPADGGGCTSDDEAEDADDGGNVPVETFVAELRQASGLNGDSAIDPARIAAIAAQRPRCNDEIRHALGGYLTSAIADDVLRETWAFVVPRSGNFVSSNGQVPLIGERLTALGEGGRLAYHHIAAPPHIDARRDRAWHYLEHHPNGEQVMAAITLFAQSRNATGAVEARLCPIAAAESDRQVAILRAQ